MQKYGGKAIFFAFHVVAVGLLIFFTQTFASWYLTKIPARGVDLYNSVTHATQYSQKFSLPFNSYKDYWYTGSPVFADFPQLSYMLMSPFVAQFGGPIGVQIFALTSLVLLVVFSYLLFYELSKNVGLSIFLAVLVFLSVNLYGSLTWAGSIPYFFSQSFFPLGLWFGVKYMKNPRIRYLGLMMLVVGIGIIIHPLAIVAYLIPSLLLLIITGGIGARFSIVRLLQHIFLFISGFILCSFTYTYSYFYTIFIQRVTSLTQTSGSGEVGNVTEGAKQIAEFYKGQVARLINDTDERLFVLLPIAFVLFIIGVIAAKNRKRALFVIPLIFIALYVALHPALNLAGYISFFKHDPYRAFWQFPIALGAVIAGMWGFFQMGLLERVGTKLKAVVYIVVFGVSAVFVFFSFVIFNLSSKSVIERIDASSDTSSAFPEVLSMKLKKEDQNELKKQLLPSFINTSERNKRVYFSDATVNIWWNSIYNIPLARGYIDPPLGTTRRAGLFLLDISTTNDTIIRDFEYPKETAINFAQYFTDWYGVHYFEGGHVSPAANAPPSSYLLDSDFFDKKEEVTVMGAIHRFGTKSGKPEARFDLPQSLVFYKVNDKYTSPIVSGTNAPIIAVFSDDGGFEQVWRGLAMENLNSRFVIPVHAGQVIDNMSKADLENFDAVILHNYSYNNKNNAFDMLSKFVEKGGNIFIDTGGEVKDADTDSLHELFPIQSSQRKAISKEWEWDIVEDPLTKGIDFDEFAPPIYEKDAWKLSYPKDGSEVREGATVVLSNNGKPALVTMDHGEGKVIWSGLNLLSHIHQYPIPTEGMFLKNILQSLVPLTDGNVVPVNAKWDRSELIRVSTDKDVKGILVKEQMYDGWSVKGAGGNSKMYKAGPTYPGFMYIPVHTDGQVNLELFYSGPPLFWAVTFVNVAAILLVLDVVLLKGRLVFRHFHGTLHRVKKKSSSWWEKEEDA